MDGTASDSNLLIWLFEHMSRPRACELCGRLTAPGDLTECTVITMRRLDMGSGISEIGDGGVGQRLIWLCPTCPHP